MRKTMIYIVIVLAIFLSSCIEKTASEKPPTEEELSLLWSYPYSDESVSLSLVSGTPTIIDNDRVLIFPDGNLTMIDTETGNEKWQYSLPENSPIISNKIIHDEESIYIKHDKLSQGVILDLENGNEKKQFNSGANTFFDFINDDYSDNELYLIGKNENGNVRSLLIYTKQGVFVKDLSFEHKITSVNYHDGSLVTTHSYREGNEQNTLGEIQSYNISLDTLNWKYETDKGSYLYAPIIIDDNIIYAGTTSGPSEFVALNIETGEKIWRKTDLQAWSYTLEGELLYINDGSSLLALNRSNGSQIWKTTIPGGGHGEANIVYLNNHLYHSHSGTFFVLDAKTGEIVHQTILPDGSNSRNVSARAGKIFVQSGFNLYCFKSWEESE